MNKKLKYCFVISLLVSSVNISATSRLDLLKYVNLFRSNYMDCLLRRPKISHLNYSDARFCKQTEKIIESLEQDAVSKSSLKLLFKNELFDFIYFCSIGMQTKIDYEIRSHLERKYSKRYGKNDKIAMSLHPRNDFLRCSEIVDFKQPIDIIKLRKESQDNAKNWELMLIKMTSDERAAFGKK